MTISPLAGKPAPKEMLIDPVRLEREYFERRPDLDDPSQLVSFGTSGHRGSPLRGSFTEAHILAITQAICDYRKAHGAGGPLFMGKAAPGMVDTQAEQPQSGPTMRVLSGDSPPRDAYVAVEYNNRWFWIADTDIQSKATFGVVILLFGISETGIKGSAPWSPYPPSEVRRPGERP